MAQLGSSIINGSLSVTGRVNLADYLYGNVCGNLCGTATNATCFGGCTFTQACTTIRSGLTDCTGTVTQVKIGDTAYDPTSGVISLPEYPSVSTVNNNKITIQKNSTAVGSFTLNQSSDCSINISVPTKVSELTNDSGFTTNTGTVTIADKAKTNANTPIALCSGATSVGKSSGCGLNFNTCTGVLSMATLSATNVCGSSYVRTPVVMSNATSGVSANNNVTIRVCCTSDVCCLCYRDFVFCGSTGRMHGNVCGTVYGNLCGEACYACRICRTAVTTGEYPVQLAGGCTTTSTGGLCVAGASVCQLKYNVATGVLTATKFCGAFDGSQADIKCISNCCTGTAKSYICVWADCGTPASLVYCSNSTICSIGNDESCNLICSCSLYNAKNSICSVSSRGSHVLLCSCGIHSTDGYADMCLSVTGSNNGNLILHVYNNNKYTTYACLQNACIYLVGCNSSCSTNCKTSSYINLFNKETDLCSKCAIDSAKFGGCTFAQACTAIRSGLLSLSISGHTITFA